MSRNSRNAKKKLYALTEKLNDTLEIPQSAGPGSAQIELFGNREARVDGCQNILQYDDTAIRISTGRLVICFSGSDLSINAMQQNQIRITGTILSVDFA